jgi:hypothetical protein
MKLYLFEPWGECRGFCRDDRGLLKTTCEDELPESLYDADEGTLLVWEGEILNTSTMTEAECDERGIPYEEAKGCEEWWQGTMRPATNAEILAVFANTPDADAGGVMQAPRNGTPTLEAQPEAGELAEFLQEAGRCVVAQHEAHKQWVACGCADYFCEHYLAYSKASSETQAAVHHLATLTATEGTTDA